MSDINLLPDELRKKEEALRQATPKPTPPPFTWREPTLSKGVSISAPKSTPPPVKPAPAPVVPPLPRPPVIVPPKIVSPIIESVKPVLIHVPGGGWRTWVRSFFMTVPKAQGTTRTDVQARERRNEGSLGVNLLTSSDGSSFSSGSIFHGVTVSLIVLGVTLIVLVGGWLLLRQEADARAGRADVLNEELARARKGLAEATQSMEGMKSLTERLRQTQILLDGHPSIGQLFTFLEKETHADVQLTSVVIRPEDNRVLLEVVALNVPSLVGQLMHWTGARETVAALSVTSVARQERPDFVGPVYAFDVTIEFVPSFFHPFARATAATQTKP